MAFIKKWCLNFCKASNRNTRKKLIENLQSINNYTSSLLCPLFSRLIATLKNIVPNIAEVMLEYIKVKNKLINRVN